MRRLSICLILSVWTSLLIAQFTDMSASLTGVLQSSVAWGDYDNDGDLDIALCGWTGSERISKVYRNDGGTFVDLSASLIGVNAGSVAWGDFDNDGDLDLVLMGFNPSVGAISKIYRNDAGTFVEHPSSLRGSELGATAWGDYDNDGDLDLMITGLGKSTIYRNDEGSFLDITAGLTGVSNSSAAWGDYDNDGDLDILLTGLVDISNFVTKVYRNDGGGVFVDIGASLIGVSTIGGSSISRSAEWGDYDNDGDLDILVTGRTVANELVAKVYRNDAGNFSDIEAGIIGISESSVAWGDYDNDGDLDIALCGWTGSESISKIYRNDNGTFVVDISAILIGVNIGSVAWGDYDNDGDLDILLTGGGGGTGFIAKIFRNEISKSNTSPTSPSGLISSSSMNSVTLQWNKSTDLETPQNGLTYNLRMGKTPGGSEIVSPMANVSTGYRRIPELGNTNHRNSWTINNLSPGTYYWSAQAIDNAFAGSAFATEQSFTVTIYTVWNEANDGAGSLRQAIQDANTHPGLDFIVFNIPGPGPHTILPTSPLPSITDPVIIDGTTQPGFSGTPVIELDGTNSGAGANGIDIQTSQCVIRGFVINRFSTGYGIYISGPIHTGNAISGNYIGIDMSGQLARSNQRGIQIENSSGNTIGGLTPMDRNVVSGQDIGINIISDANNNIVVGNFVGTNFDGTAAIPNVNGIWVQNSSGNIVGGSSVGARNIVSGNDDNGIWIDGSGTGNNVKGNYVGLAMNGDTPLGNKGFGIKINASAGNTIENNVVSANGSLSPPRHGIYIEYETSGAGNLVQGNLVGTDGTGLLRRGNINFGICVLEATHNRIINNVVSGNRYGVVLWGIDGGAGGNYNTIQGNLIGTNKNGTDGLGNELGLYIRKSHYNIVGGTSSVARNIISGNTHYGLAIGRGQSSNNVVQGNYIGLDINGSTTPLSNGYDHPTLQGFGVDVFDATENIIGGPEPGAANVISGNIGYGILINKDVESTTNNFIQGNLVGTDRTGMTAVGNTFGVAIKDASANTIGGTSTGDRNIISGNTDDGINILGASASGNVVAGNYVGIAADGASALGNGDDGINIDSPNNTIGGTTAGAGNVFSANGSHGIVIVGSSATGNRVMGNYVGTDKDGVIDQGNNEGGIFIGNGASGNIIGGTTQEERNIISANGVNPDPFSGKPGVTITGAGTTGNVVIGNYIGTDVSGAVKLGNRGDGIHIRYGASGNTIGGTNSVERNVISGNGVTGIAIFGNGTNGNNVLGNYIGLDATGTQNLGHVDGTGVYIGMMASNNMVGGTVSGAGNFISGNIGWAGVAIDGANNNTIVGNSIGTDINGTASFGNLIGVRIYNGASGNKIGGTAAGEGNLIVHSLEEGVLVADAISINNAILSNSIQSNSGLGIDLRPGDESGNVPPYVTANDVSDEDIGPNNLQNYPVLSSAKYDRGRITVRGTLNNTANTIFSLQFFANSSPDASGYGEGQLLIGSIKVTTDGGGNASFSELVSGSAPAGSYITATATDPNNNTSEFSGVVRLSSPDIVVPAGYVSEIIASNLSQPQGMAFDGSGNLFVAASGSGEIIQIGSSGVSVVATNFSQPIDVTFDGASTLYVSDLNRNGVFAIDLNGALPVNASALTPLVGGLDGPTYLRLMPGGQLLVSVLRGTTQDRIVRINFPGPIVSDYVTFFQSNHNPEAMIFDANGDLLIALQALGEVRKATLNPPPLFLPIDGRNLPAVLKGLDSPTGIVIGGDGRLYIATRYDIDVSKPGSNTWTPFLTGLSGSLFNNVIVGPAGQLYVADRDGGRIIRVGAPRIQIVATGGFPLPYMINEKGEPTITDNSVFTAIHNAFKHWQDVGTSTAAFQNDGPTPQTNASALDSVNLVTFSDQEFLFPPGVLAVAAKTIELDAGSQTAKIVDADIVFNPYWIGNTSYRYGTDTRPGAFDIESIATHEIGHILGLVHSGVLDATMFFVLQKGTDARTLETDDHAWVGQQYPAASFSSSFGSIAGTIRYGYDNQTLVAGALVRATNSTTGKAVHSYSTENGAYLIPGLEAGNYKVSMQPLNGDVDGFPMTPAHVSAYIQAITNITDYPKEFFNEGDVAIEDPEAFSLVAVTAGQTTAGVNFVTNIDVTPPEIIAVFPADGATEVDLLTEVIVTFSEPVDVNTVNIESINISNGNGSTQGTFLFLKGNQVVLFTPKDPLAPNAPYVLSVTTGVTDARGNALAASFSSTFTTKSTDVDPPLVTQVVPESAAADVFVTAKIVVIFSEPILSSSLTASSFTVSSDGVNVDGTITLTQDNKVATLTPASILAEGTKYEIKVTTDVQDLFSNHLEAEFTSTFTTVAQAPPAVVFVGPEDNATGISVTTPVLVDFSEPINPSTVTGGSFILSIGGSPVQGTFDFLNDDSRVVFRPSENLEFNSQYQLRITTAVRDRSQSGEQLAEEFIGSFTTASEVLQPTISSIDPPAGVIGTAVVIAGEGFDPDPTKNAVSFSGVIGVMSDPSLTSVTAKVPQDAISGPVTVSVRGVTSNSHHFDVLKTIDDPKNVVVASVDTDSEPRDADVTPDGTLAYVTNAGANSVSVIDLNVLAPAVITSIQVGNTPLKIAINPQGTLAYVTNFLSNTVSVIDIKPGSPTRHQVIAAIPVEINPIGVVVTPDGRRVYVANFTSKSMSVIDADPKSGAFHHVIAKVDMDSEPRDVDVSPDGTLAFVAAKSGLIIINIDPSAPAFNSVVANVDTDSEARDIEVTPDGTLAIVVTANGAILIIDIFPRSPGFGQVVASVDSDSGPREAEVTPDGTLVYITNFKTNDVSVFEFVYSQGVIGGVSPITTAGVRLKFLETIPVGKAPEGIVIDHLARRAVVVNSGSNDVTIIGITSDDVAVTLLIEQIQNLIDNPSTPAAALGNLRKAKQNLEQAIKRLSEGKTLQFFDELNQAVHDLLKAARDGAIVSDIINLIVKTARRLAQDALNAAIGFAGKKNVDEQIDKAKKEMAAADQAVAAGDFENAIAHFRLAWDAAQRAIQLALKGSGFNQEQADATVKETVPTEFALNQNYPNPFNSTTQVSFDIPLRAENGIHVELKVYNLLGQLVNTLVNEIRAPGSYTVLWRGNHYDGRAAASGLYILHIRAGEFRAARKMILLQ